MNNKRHRTALLLMALTLFCGTAGAQHRHHHHYSHYPHSYPHRIVTVVAKPQMTSRVSNHFNQKERLAMALAYLETHECLTINQYAEMTQLNTASAEAELDAFAMGNKSPISLVLKGKKKLYIKNE